MRTAAFRRPAAGLILGLLPLMAVASCGEEPAKRFPGAFQGAHTDVSAARAFRDHAIDLPASAKVEGYYAWSADDTYPMAAVLRTPCSSVPRFVAGNGFRRTTSVDEHAVATEVFAEGRGWTANDTDDRYVRHEADDVTGLVVHASGTECEVYLHT
ncbi:hypothetical protein [Streptomyces sp. NPDC093094]|uniref:hypothetical protein n=1 Tax=Streptomyces sp. NPDC093094 TaxID=3366026 RepID=UPI003814E4FA